MSRNLENHRKSDNKIGRPSKADPPRIPYQDVDRLLVFGEVVQTSDGKNAAVFYPTHRQIARRFNVSHSVITSYAKAHNCSRRRKDAAAQVAMKVDKKLIEARATAIAVSKEDALRMIDTYLVGFERAIVEERVRFDNPSDFNMMIRLKEFIQGGADSRQEIHAALSLEDLQTRHKQMLKVIEESSAKERGEVGAYDPAAILASKPINKLNPPPDSLENAATKVTGHFLEQAADSHEGQFPSHQQERKPGSRPRSRQNAAYAPDDFEGDNASFDDDEADTGTRVAPAGQASQSGEDGDDHIVNKSSNSGLFILPPPPEVDKDER